MSQTNTTYSYRHVAFGAIALSKTIACVLTCHHLYQDISMRTTICLFETTTSAVICCMLLCLLLHAAVPATTIMIMRTSVWLPLGLSSIIVTSKATYSAL
eukprot:18597-Heterococcus_DN1.PRE.3